MVEKNKEEVHLVNMIRKESTNPIVVKNNPKFNSKAGNQSRELEEVLRMSILANLPLLITGPTGTGKTTAVLQLAFDMSQEGTDKSVPVDHEIPIPFIRYQCSKESGHYDMCGHEVVKGGNVMFDKGSLFTAVDMANKYGLAILLLDEINAMPPEGQKALNPLLEKERAIILGDRKHVLHEGARLGIFATMNNLDVGYGGIGNLNTDLLRRFPLKIRLDYPKTKEEIDILMSQTSTNDKTLAEQLVRLAHHTRNADGQQENSLYTRTPISTADLTNFLEVYTNTLNLFEFRNTKESIAYALKHTILASLDDEERNSITEKIKDIFEIDLIENPVESDNSVDNSSTE